MLGSKSERRTKEDKISLQVQECRTIHNAIVTLQKKLLGNSDLVVGRRGNANYTNLADFVRLIHQNLTEKAEIELKALLPSCGVPSLLRITVLHTAGREARQGELGLFFFYIYYYP